MNTKTAGGKMKTKWLGVTKEIEGIPKAIGRLFPTLIFKGLKGVQLMRGEETKHVKSSLEHTIGFHWPEGLPSIYFHDFGIIFVDLDAIDTLCRLERASSKKRFRYYLTWVTHEFVHR